MSPIMQFADFCWDWLSLWQKAARSRLLLPYQFSSWVKWAKSNSICFSTCWMLRLISSLKATRLSLRKKHSPSNQYYSRTILLKWWIWKSLLKTSNWTQMIVARFTAKNNAKSWCFSTIIYSQLHFRLRACHSVTLSCKSFSIVFKNRTKEMSITERSSISPSFCLKTMTNVTKCWRKIW